MLGYLQQIWHSKTLRNRILFTLFIIVIYRIVSQISIPNANLDALRTIFQTNQFLGAFSVLTGGNASNFSILLMGLSPYINASIIIQLLTVIIPKLENLSKEGEAGRKKLNSYTRWLTLPLAFLQSYGMIVLLNSQTQGVPIVEGIDNPSVLLPIMVTVTAGTVFLMWLGELMSERGIGNGISMLIFVSIISGIPAVFGQSLFLSQQDTEKILPFVIIVLMTIALTIMVVIITEAQRKLPITYAGRGIKAKTDQASLPLRINQAGMIPIIFAVSIMSFPQVVGQLLTAAKSEWLRNFGEFLVNAIQLNSIPYLVIYFLLVFGFTYFYVSITFNPEQVAENIQKRGGYIPGLRPGTQTAEYIAKVSNRLTFFGGIFIAFVAVLPLLIQRLFTTLDFGSMPLIITGAGMIIIVGVVLELIRQINAQLVLHDYSKFY